MFDILWSDPQHNEGCQPNGLRGAGTYFGPDVTYNFLQKNKLVFLVRSHECKHDGYEIVHSGKVSCNRYQIKTQTQLKQIQTYMDNGVGVVSQFHIHFLKEIRNIYYLVGH